MPYQLVKTICQAHYIVLDDEGNTVDEILRDPVNCYGREAHNAFIDDCDALLADHAAGLVEAD